MDEFNMLYKRLLLQPISFDVLKTDDGGVVVINEEGKVGDLTKHLVDTTVELLFINAVYEVFSERGIHNAWTKHKLIKHLDLDEMDQNWFTQVNEDVAAYLENSIENDSPLKLSAYMQFGAVSVKKEMIKYAKMMEELVFENVIIKSVTSSDLQDIPAHEVPSTDAIEVLGSATDMLFVTKPNSEGERYQIIDTSELVNGMPNVFSGLIYNGNSERYKEVQFYTYTLSMMKRWDIEEWFVAGTVYSTLERFRQKIDIPVLITNNGS